MNTTVSVEIVTARMAEYWLSNRKYLHQRSINPQHVNYLADEMRMGEFKQDTTIEFTVVGNNTYLTDGQHRLSAIVMTGIPHQFVIVRRFAVDEQKVAFDYNRTDQGRARSIAEQYKTLDLETELGLPFKQINNLGSAVAFIHQEFGKGNSQQRKIHPKDRLAAMREYGDACRLYLDAIAGGQASIRGRLERRSSMGVALITFHFSAKIFGQEKVADFWQGIAYDDGLRSKDPRKAAIRHLMEFSMEGGGQFGKRTTPFFSSRYLAGCFDAYVTDRQISFVRVDVNKDIVILGSPFV